MTTVLPPPPPPLPPDPSAMVEVNGVSKVFGDIVAVSDVSFSVRAGVTALLGPNGAGKSTLFRVMCGLTPPTKGTVRVLGADARRDRDVRGRIGLSPQQDGLFDRLSALQFVTLAAATEAVDDPEGAARRALGVVDLDPDDSKRLSGFSKGMRQRVKLAAALVHDPRGADPRRAPHRAGPGAAASHDRAVPRIGRRGPLRAGV